MSTAPPVFLAGGSPVEIFLAAFSLSKKDDKVVRFLDCAREKDG
jgi:hypothetical protein